MPNWKKVVLSGSSAEFSTLNVDGAITASGFSGDGSGLTGITLTETDPIFSAHTASSITSGQIGNWNTAYGWGDHSLEGYLTSYTETDPTVPSHVKSITTGNISNWNTAYGWGDHDGLYLPVAGGSIEGNLTVGGTITAQEFHSELVSSSIVYESGSTKFGDSADDIHSFTGSLAVLGNISANNLAISNWNTAYNWGDHSQEGYITGYTETDPIFLAHTASSITDTHIINWNIAYGWGNHANAGYLTTHPLVPGVPSDINNSGGTVIQDLSFDANGHVNGVASVNLDNRYLQSFTETDPVFSAHTASSITDTHIINWNIAYSWGDHSTQGYLTSYTDTNYYVNAASFNTGNGVLSLTGVGSAGATVDLDGRYLLADGNAESATSASYAVTASYALTGPFAATSHTHDASDINAGTLATARIPNLSASKITSGTISDARLPDTISSDITGNAATATSALLATSASHAEYADDAGYAASAGSATSASYAANADKLDGQDSSYYRNASNLNTGTINDARLPDNISSNITGNAATATSASYASNADLLDGQEGSYYRNASNINAGTINDARLPNSISSNITGNAATATTASFASTAPYSGLTGTVPTWNQNTTGNAATATTASFASTAPYSGLTGTVPTWNQNTTGNAATADTATTASYAETATTQAGTDDSIKIATTAFVQDRIDTIIGTAGSTLDTLGELSASLAQDSGSLASLVTTVGGKLQKDQNLSDLTNASTARTNLGLGNVENTALSTWTGDGGALDNQYITNGAGYITDHPTISAASSINNSGNTVIQDITLDSNGHITGLASLNLNDSYYTESEIDTKLTNGTVNYIATDAQVGTNIHFFKNDGGGNLGIRFNAGANPETSIEDGSAWEFQFNNDSQDGDFVIYYDGGISGSGQTISWTESFRLDGGDSDAYVWGNRVLTTADEGSGNGLDADTLDGEEGSFYRNASNINAGTLAAARIPNLDAAKITTGTFDEARIPKPSSGAWWSGFPIVGGDGVMEVGKYLDFHDSDAETDDYSYRMTASNTNMAFSGTITATGYNNTNWDSAYSFTSGFDITDYTDPKYARTDVADTASDLTINTLTIGTSNKIKFANNDYIRYDDANGVGRFHFDADGGTNNATVQAATFVGALSGNATSATNADTVDSLHASSFVRSDADDTRSGNLTVTGDTTIAQNKYIYFDNGAHYIRRGASNVEIQGYNGLDLRTNATTRIFADQNGNVGIHTATPSAPLEVYGSGSTVFDVQGSVGQLFSVTDDLTGDIFSVSDISGIPIFNINASGQVDIDGDLDVTGDITAYSTSDIRLKKNIKPIEEPLEKLKLISGNTFEWDETSTAHNNKGKDVGVIAQEIEKVLPEIVGERKGHKAVQYEKIVALLIESNKALLARVEELEAKIK